MLLQKDSFGYYDVDKKALRVNPGVYVVQIGASSEDIRLTAEITIEKEYIYA